MMITQMDWSQVDVCHGKQIAVWLMNERMCVVGSWTDGQWQARISDHKDLAQHEMRGWCLQAPFLHQLQPTGLQLASGHPHCSLIHVESMGGLVNSFRIPYRLLSVEFWRFVYIFMHILPYILTTTTTTKISENCSEDNPNIEKVILAQFRSKQSAFKTVSAKMRQWTWTLHTVLWYQ